MTSTTTDSTALEALLTDYSLEMTGKDVPALLAARRAIPVGTRVNVTFLGNEDLETRVAAARAVRESGLVPVPHVSARRLATQQELDDFLVALRSEEATDNVFVVGGDPAAPHGPYGDALAVIRSDRLEPHGVGHVSVAGYPEGHPAIADDALWAALEAKSQALADRGIPGAVITQFGFDVDAAVAWIEAVRARGITLPIRIGVPGPAGIRRLVRYASRFGVGTSAGIARKYGFSITNLMGTAGPDRYLAGLAARYRPEAHGAVGLHFYTFGGLETTAEWIRVFRERSMS